MVEPAKPYTSNAAKRGASAGRRTGAPPVIGTGARGGHRGNELGVPPPAPAVQGATVGKRQGLTPRLPKIGKKIESIPTPKNPNTNKKGAR